MCTSLAAGKKATRGGVVLISRNEDYTQNNWNKYLAYRLRPEYYYDPSVANPVVKDNQWTLGNGLRVPVPKKMFKYSAAPDAAGEEEASSSILNHFFFEERGINERNVAISATTSMEDANDRAQAADPFIDRPGIAECIIPTLILPQAETARDGVELLGNYVATYGASEGNGVLIGDPNEAWYVEIGSAHCWIAVRVPDDSYIVVANSMRVDGVDLTDDANVLSSEGLFEFVDRHRLLDKPDKHHFDFAKAFGKTGDPYSVDRIWLAQRILTPSRHQEPRLPQYPLFLSPDKDIEVQDIMGVLRATYKGTELELDEKANRPIGVAWTSESHIMTLDPEMPPELQGMIWQAIGTPLGSPYMPLYSVMNDIPLAYARGSGDYSPASGYWAFRGLFALASADRNEYVKELQRLWRKYECQFIHEQDYIKQMLLDMDRADPCAAIEFARRYSTGIAYQMVGIANQERDKLVTTITRETDKRPARQ